MPTIKDVARAAGVSIATVSRVLNHRDRVDDETRKHVFRIVEKMQYTPNNIAVSMVRKRSKILAAIIPDLINPFYSSVIHGVEAAAKEERWGELEAMAARICASVGQCADVQEVSDVVLAPAELSLTARGELSLNIKFKVRMPFCKYCDGGC